MCGGGWPAAGWKFLRLCVVQSGIREGRIDFRSDLSPVLACANPFCETPNLQNFPPAAGGQTLPHSSNSASNSVPNPYKTHSWFHIYTATSPSGNVIFWSDPKQKTFWCFAFQDNSGLFPGSDKKLHPLMSLPPNSLLSLSFHPVLSVPRPLPSVQEFCLQRSWRLRDERASFSSARRICWSGSMSTIAFRSF